MATNISRIEINAELDKVWAALTKPELVKQWQYGSELTTDWKIGSIVFFFLDLILKISQRIILKWNTDLLQ